MHEDIIARVLHNNVIPSLTKTAGGRTGAAAFGYHQSDIAGIVKLLRDGREQEILQTIDGFLSKGSRHYEVYLDVFCECARHLGELWARDECSFSEVTLGLAFLNSLIHRYRHGLGPELPDTRCGKVFITSIPGDTHMTGAAMLEAFFSAAGWQCDVLLDGKEKDIAKQVSEQVFDIVGISVARSEDISRCKQMVRLVRRNSKNPEIKVLVGGNAFKDNPRAIAAVEADGFSEDALSALIVAEDLLREPRHHGTV